MMLVWYLHKAAIMYNFHSRFRHNFVILSIVLLFFPMMKLAICYNRGSVLQILCQAWCMHGIA